MELIKEYTRQRIGFEKTPPFNDAFVSLLDKNLSMAHKGKQTLTLEVDADVNKNLVNKSLVSQKRNRVVIRYLKKKAKALLEVKKLPSQTVGFNAVKLHYYICFKN